ncbi:hypothetical protein AALO_G00097870 [Alosa alosa]|uniref:Uncharacterized protein n=1 Tax=Alosa alosa TaxID=278164 RepID=A0AAV6GT69_9TELE|nr:hypothetical protein AALO_G00097870 [Alosa alosa]
MCACTHSFCCIYTWVYVYSVQTTQVKKHRREHFMDGHEVNPINRQWTEDRQAFGSIGSSRVLDRPSRGILTLKGELPAVQTRRSPRSTRCHVTSGNVRYPLSFCLPSFFKVC